MLVASALADAITEGLGQALPSPVPVVGFATGIIDELTFATATFGGVPGPHVISGMSGSSLASKIQAAAGYPSVSSELSNFAAAIVAHIQTMGIVTYVGPPPPAVPNFFQGGLISGLSGSVLAASAGFPSVTSELLGMCSAITDYIMANAQVEMGVIS